MKYLFFGLIGLMLSGCSQVSTGKVLCPGIGVVSFVSEPKFDGPWVEVVDGVGHRVKLNNCVAVIWDSPETEQQKENL